VNTIINTLFVCFCFQYIERNSVQDLGRGHFSFNTKVNVGEFYEARVSGGENVRDLQLGLQTFPITVFVKNWLKGLVYSFFV